MIDRLPEYKRQLEKQAREEAINKIARAFCFIQALTLMVSIVFYIIIYFLRNI